MHSSIKNGKIVKFENELYVAHKQGYIFRYVHTTELDDLSSSEKILGVEILFSDVVTPTQVSKIQAYILMQYGFEIDDTLCDDVNILIVRYS